MRVLNEKNDRFVLDAKDSQILRIYSQNVRTPLSTIAKKCGLSRNSVEYRIKQMHNLGLITGHKTIINTKKLGFVSFHVFLSLENSVDSEEFETRAKNAPFVNALISYRGKFSYELSIMARTDIEFLSYYNSLMKDLRITHEEILTLLKMIKSRVIPRKFLKNLPQETIQIKNKKEIDCEIDNVDFDIINILAEDAIKTNIEIAKKLNLRRETIQYRIKRLIESNYLVQFRPAINYYSLGLSIHTLLIKLDRNEEEVEKFEKKLMGESVVIWAVRTFGKYDFIIYVLTSQIDQFHEFLDNVRESYGIGIKTYELLFAYRSHKYSFLSKNIFTIKS